MTEDQLFETILHDTYTLTDFHRRLKLLRDFLENSFFTQQRQSYSDFFKKHQISASDLELLSSWGDNFYNSFEQENVYKILKNLEEKIKDIPIVTVYLPLAINSPMPANIGKWFRENIKSIVLLDLKTDYSLVLGAAIVYNGIYRDFSLHYYISKYKDEILSIIGEY